MEAIENVIFQEIQSLFWHQLRHNPAHISCKLYDSKLVVVIKDALTKPEQLLISNGYEEIAQRIRHSIEEILQPQLKNIIETVTDTKVNNLLLATHIDSNYISIIALLNEETEEDNSQFNFHETLYLHQNSHFGEDAEQ